MPSKFLALVERIESADFSARLNVVSGLQSFLLALECDLILIELRELAKNAEGAAALLIRTLQIASQETDSRFEHPQDIALAAYLQILRLDSPDYFDIAKRVVLRLTNSWWSRSIARNDLLTWNRDGDDPSISDDLLLDIDGIGNVVAIEGTATILQLTSKTTETEDSSVLT